MLSHAAQALDFYDALMLLINIQSEWSQATFGPDNVRGPKGPLKHLAKEAAEAAEEPDRNKRLKEHADCLILHLDATRRDGFTFKEIIAAAIAKMTENRERTWPAVTDVDAPVEHVRTPEEVTAKTPIGYHKDFELTEKEISVPREPAPVVFGSAAMTITYEVKQGRQRSHRCANCHMACNMQGSGHYNPHTNRFKCKTKAKPC